MRKNSINQFMTKMNTVDFATYINSTRYLQQERRYILCSNSNTGNKTWKDKDTNAIVAQRILSNTEDEEDTYKIASYIIQKMNTTNKLKI